MKTIKIITLTSITALILSFTSCDDFLTPYNPVGQTEDMLYQTEDGFEAGVNGAYSYIRKLWGLKQGVYLMEAGTDLWTTGSEPQSETLLHYIELGSGENYVRDNLWANSYFAIYQCNTMLQYLEYAKPATRTNREAEMRVLRSYFWWVLTENFENIHFSTEPNAGNTKGIKGTPEQVYEQIFKDLEFAITGNNLPNTSTDLGRITKPVAEALLARICLTRGKNTEAITYAKNVINNYGYELETLDRLWNPNLQRSNKEVIWAVNRHENATLNGGVETLNGVFSPRFTTLTKTGLLFGFSSTTDPIAGDGNVQSGRLMPTYRLLSLFDQDNDARFKATFKSAWKANTNTDGLSAIVIRSIYPRWTAADAAEYGNASLANEYRFGMGDTSLLLIFNNDNIKRFPKVPYNTLDQNDFYDAETKAPIERRAYFQLMKHFDSQVKNTSSTRDFFMIRLSEMYLIIAEADFKVNGSNAAEGLKYLNDLRKKRATTNADAAFTNVTSIPNIDFILDERARELCGEQLRWLDLKRTGKLVEYVRNYNPDATGIKDFHIRRPYPQTQLDQMSNPEIFVQEGY